MAIQPVVRYMLLCDDWSLDQINDRRITIIGLISHIRSIDDPPYPLLREELCVFMLLTDCYGQGEGKIVFVDEESGQEIFETRPRLIRFGSDPLEVMGVSFRIRDCPFPKRDFTPSNFGMKGNSLRSAP